MKTTSGITTYFLVDHNRPFAQVVEEQDDLGNVQVIYTHGDDLINQQRAEGTYTYHYDGLGSTRVLTDTDAIAVNDYTYKAFGEIESQTVTVPNRYLFTGEQYDQNVGFYYLRSRYYDPAIGRFPTIDTRAGLPFEPFTLHKYLYVMARPSDLVDPSGKTPLSEFGLAQFIQTQLLRSTGTQSLKVAFKKSGFAG